MAYRHLARQHHPDARGNASVERMSQINEAWRVLSDPGRRAVYDAQSRGSAASRTPSGQATNNGSFTAGVRTTSRPTVFVQPAPTPARFPWRFMLVVATLGIAFILVNAALTKQDTRDVPDNLINAGSCVNIAENGDAIEVSCGGTHAGVVDSLISFDGVCPSDTESHRDRQGMGQVCVRRVTGAFGG